jgi:hypothetical protein
MNSENISITEEIEKALDRRPFQPFVIVMSSGERHEVTGRHQAAVGQAVIVIVPPDQSSIYLRTNQIVSLELAAPAI